MVEHEDGARPAPFSVGGNLSMHGSNLAGGNQHIGDTVHGNKVDKVVKNFRIRLGLGLLALALLGGGGYVVGRKILAEPTDVVYEEGLDGAADTAAAIRQAEVDGNAADWCFLVAANAGDSCLSMMSSAFGGQPELRAEVADVAFGAASGSGNSAQLDVSFRGTKMGVVPLRWNGDRWELETGVYFAAVNNGGLAMSAVLTHHGCGALFGMTMGCDT